MNLFNGYKQRLTNNYMKKVLFLILIILTSTNRVKASDKWGEGELQLTKRTVYNFIKYIRGNVTKRPLDFYVTTDGAGSVYWFCPSAGQCMPGNHRLDIKECNQRTGKKCKKFAVRRTIKWKNGINPAKGKASTINSKWTDDEIFAKLTELGFYNNTSSKTQKKQKAITKKKKETKISKTITGKRSLAMSWEGYDDLILGSLQFNEKDLVGSLNLKLPNNDGNCKGTYALSTDKGTWSLLCDKNNMSASGTLKWNNKDGSVTGEGKDTKGKKVKFTVQGET